VALDFNCSPQRVTCGHGGEKNGPKVTCRQKGLTPLR